MEILPLPARYLGVMQVIIRFTPCMLATAKARISTDSAKLCACSSRSASSDTSPTPKMMAAHCSSFFTSLRFIHSTI